MAWQLLAAALPAAAKVAGTALSKPRQEDYKPQTDYMKKYLSYIRGRSSDREVMHQAMQPALRVAGKQGRQMQRQVGYDVAKSGLGGSGIEAQMRLSAGQQTQDALATATDKAVAAQTAETARVGEQAAGITAQIGAEEARADQAFKSAESQWKRQLTSDVIGGAASLASAGITQAGQLKEAQLMATRTGYFGSEADVQNMADQKWTAEMFQTETNRMTTLMQNVDPADAKAYYGINTPNSGTVTPEPKPIISKEESGNFKSSFEKGDQDMIDATDALLTEQQSKANLAETQKVTEVKPLSTETPYVGQKVIDGVKYNVNAEGVPVSSYAPETPKKKTGYDLYAESMRESNREPLSEKKWRQIGKNIRAKQGNEKGKLAGDLALENQQLAETQRLIGEDKERDRRRKTTKKVLVEGAGKAAYKQTYAKLKAEKDAARQKGQEPKTEKENSYAVQSFEDQPDYGVTVEAFAPAKKGKKYKIERKGKEHSVIVTNVDKENKKVTLRDTVLNKEYKTSFDKFDEYRGATNMASKEIEPIFSTVQKFEKGNRAKRHNNLGAVVWTKNLQNKYPEMEKGDSFVDSDGVTRYTAKFSNKETGDRINKQIMQEMFKSVGGDTAKFYARWSGLPINSDTVQNFVKEVEG
tara:strand:+ start:505 stop:2427 length:1923 start_codon:yes stop_codon:yes gene_type:complete